MRESEAHLALLDGGAVVGSFPSRLLARATEDDRELHALESRRRASSGTVERAPLEELAHGGGVEVHGAGDAQRAGSLGSRRPLGWRHFDEASDPAARDQLECNSIARPEHADRWALGRWTGTHATLTESASVVTLGAGTPPTPRRILGPQMARTQQSGGMSGREARAFQSDIRGAGARRREVEQTRGAIRAVDARGAQQRTACADELVQVKESATAATWQAKLAARTAAAHLKEVRLDGTQRVKQKVANCAAEARAIKAERPAAAQRVVTPAIGRAKTSARIAQGEARDEVEQNIPAELVPLWRRERGAFRLTPRQVEHGTTLTEAFLERVEAEPEAVHAAQVALAGRRSAPSRADQSEEKRVVCDRARKEAQAAVARGEADPRQLNWLAKFCKSPKAQATTEVPF